MRYDIAVLGGGPGGYVAAIRAAQLGARTVLIEKEKLGGVCLNRGCIPTKALLHSAEIYSNIYNTGQFGIDIPSFSLDFSKVMKEKENIVETLYKGIHGLMAANGIDVIQGVCDIQAPDTVTVSESAIHTDNIIIAVGSSPAVLPVPGTDNPCVITSDQALFLDKIPASMSIIGGGVVGVEMATIFNAFGCRVMILEMADRLVPMMDPDISDTLRKLLEGRGITVITGAIVKSIDSGKVFFLKNNTMHTVETEKILMATGRQSNGKGLSLDKLGIRHNKGFIETDSQMRTNVPAIYAIGDVNGKYMLAHVASEEGITAVENIMGMEGFINYNTIPQCIYTFPEIASAGFLEDQAVKLGYAVKVSRFPVSANGKALTEGCRDGFVKIIADSSYGQILGVHIVAPHASEMISQCVMAMNMEATVDDLANTIFPHPSVSEIVREAAHGFYHYHE